MVRALTNRERFTCCFCFHVRTGTILLGACQIIIHLIAISLLVLLTIRPDLLPYTGVQHTSSRHLPAVSDNRFNTDPHAYSVIMHLVPGMSDFQDVVSFPNHRTDEGNVNTIEKFPNQFTGRERSVETDVSAPVASVADGTDYKLNDSSGTKRQRHLSPSFALCLSTFSLAFCCFLVHGAVARQPTHLLPFFFLQVFDFIISLLTVVGYMSSTPDIHLWLRTKDGAMYINSTSWTFLLLFISLLVLVFKAYCLRMVWDCYKYLILTHNRSDRPLGWTHDRFTFLPTIWGLLGAGRQTVGARDAMNTHGQVSDLELNRQAPVIYDQSNDLPNYDDALKIPANAYAPPPYFSNTDREKSNTTVGETISVTSSVIANKEHA